MMITKENLNFLRAELSRFDESEFSSAVLEIAEEYYEDHEELTPEDFLPLLFEDADDKSLITLWLHWRGYLIWGNYGDDYWDSPYNDMFWDYAKKHYL